MLSVIVEIISYACQLSQQSDLTVSIAMSSHWSSALKIGRGGASQEALKSNLPNSVIPSFLRAFAFCVSQIAHEPSSADHETIREFLGRVPILYSPSSTIRFHMLHDLQMLCLFEKP